MSRGCISSLNFMIVLKYVSSVLTTRRNGSSINSSAVAMNAAEILSMYKCVCASSDIHADVQSVRLASCSPRSGRSATH